MKIKTIGLAAAAMALVAACADLGVGSGQIRAFNGDPVVVAHVDVSPFASDEIFRELSEYEYYGAASAVQIPGEWLVFGSGHGWNDVQQAREFIVAECRAFTLTTQYAQYADQCRLVASVVPSDYQEGPGQTLSQVLNGIYLQALASQTPPHHAIAISRNWGAGAYRTGNTAAEAREAALAACDSNNNRPNTLTNRDPSPCRVVWSQ